MKCDGSTVGQVSSISDASGTLESYTYTRPATPPERSDSVAVVSYVYDGSGNVESVFDPKGIRTKRTYDRLGRLAQQVEAFEDGVASPTNDRITSYEYTGLDQIRVMTTYNAKPNASSSEAQTTEYVYDTEVGEPGSVISFKDVLGKVIYADGSTERYAYNALGEVIKKKQRDGVIHQYEHDAAGRITSDSAVTLASGTDPAVRRLDTAYDGLGRAYLFTSYADTTGSNAVNQVARTLYGFGQIVTEQQDHDSAIGGNAQTVSYGYDASKGSRATSITYPNQREINYDYGTGLDDSISRVHAVNDGSTALESYTYLGMSRVIAVSRSLAEGSSLTMTDTLDNFGRVSQRQWTQQAPNGTADQDRIGYGYDILGNLLYARNQIFANHSELYLADNVDNDVAYDKLGRLKVFQRGTLNATNTAMMSAIANSATTYQSDTAGNFTGIIANGVNLVTASYDATNAVATNPATGNASAGGNTTSLGSNTFNDGVQGTYDAWGRLVKDVEVRFIGGAYGSTIYSQSVFAYDALGRMTALEETSTSENTNSFVAGRSNHRELFHDLAGNVIEERETITGPAVTQYVYSPSTGQIIERYRDSNLNDVLDEKVYAIYDPRGNVTAITNQVGTVIERYLYDPTGQVQVLNGQGAPITFSTSTASSSEERLSAYYTSPVNAGGFLSGSGIVGSNVAWNYYFGGMRFLHTSGLYAGDGGQTYNPRLGRTMQAQAKTNNGGYQFSAEQLNGSWAGNAWSSFWSPSSYGNQVVTGDPYYLNAIGKGAGYVSIAAFTAASGGTALAWFALGTSTGMLGGAAYSYFTNPDASDAEFWGSIETGAQIGSFAGGFPGLLNKGSAKLLQFGDEGAQGLLRLLGRTPPTAMSVVGGRTLAGSFGGRAVAVAGLSGYGGANVNWGGLFGNAVFRLPASGGSWAGTPGNSGWRSTTQAVNAITGRKPIPFRNNKIDLGQWALYSVRPRGITGIHMFDTILADRALAKQLGWLVRDVKALRQYGSLVWHHHDMRTLQLVPEALNKIPHEGPAAWLRALSGM